MITYCSDTAEHLQNPTSPNKFGQFFDTSKVTDRDVLKKQLLQKIADVEKASSATKDFVQMVGLVMTRTTGKALTDKQINYVTSRLLGNEEKVTGEIKSVINMLLLATHTLLGKEYERPILSSVLDIRRSLVEYESFFEDLDLKTELEKTPDGIFIKVRQSTDSVENFKSDTVYDEDSSSTPGTP